MSEVRVSTRYARSIIDFGREKNALETLYKDAEYFVALCEQNRDFQVMLENPIVPQKKKFNIVNQILGNDVNELTTGFIKLVIKKQRSALLVPIFNRVIYLYKQAQGITSAKVYSTLELPEQIVEQLKKLVDKDNPDKVEVENLIREDLIGGFVLQYEDKLLDKSIANQLKEMNKVLKN